MSQTEKLKVLIVAGLPDILPNEAFDVHIGVDRGSLWLIENHLSADIALGDFDSVTADEFSGIDKNAREIIRLKPEKDVTDLEAALQLAVTHFPDAAFTIIGALGGRLDHELTNIYLPTTAAFQAFAEAIQLVSQQNVVRYLSAGTHQLLPIADKKYIGFVQLATNRSLSISQAKYPLAADKNFADIYASNEFIDDKPMTVSIASGMLIVIYSSDEK